MTDKYYEEFTTLTIPEGLKLLFIDSLLAFQNYSQLKGYEIKFSFDNSVKDKLGFKFTVVTNSNSLTNEEIRADIREFLEKIQKGEEIKDIPILINEVEHFKVLTILNNKLSTIKHNAQLEKNLSFGIEQILEKVIEKKGFNQSIHIHNGKDESKNIQGDNSNINFGDKNLIEDNSTTIQNSFNKTKTIIDKIDNSIQLVNEEKKLSVADKEDLKRHLSNIKEELADEEKPNPSTIKKSFEKIKKMGEVLVFSNKLSQAIQWLGENLGF